MKFQGKTAIVTGAASGIGAAAALRLAKEGASVFAVDVNEAGLAETAETAAKGGHFVKTRACDVSVEADVESAVGHALAINGRIDTLVNVAGVSVTRYVAETSWREYARMMDVNMGGVFLFTRAVLPRMEKQQSGAIVNVASELAFVGYPDIAAYTATKGAVIAFSRSVALDAIRYGVRVNCLCPGAADTPMFWDGVTDPEQRQKMLDQVKIEKPFGRLVTMEEVSNGIVFLASDDASAVVGANLVMDGGFIIQ